MRCSFCSQEKNLTIAYILIWAFFQGDLGGTTFYQQFETFLRQSLLCIGKKDGFTEENKQLLNKCSNQLDLLLPSNSISNNDISQVIALIQGGDIGNNLNFGELRWFKHVCFECFLRNLKQAFLESKHFKRDDNFDESHSDSGAGSSYAVSLCLNNLSGRLTKAETQIRINKKGIRKSINLFEEIGEKTNKLISQVQDLQIQSEINQRAVKPANIQKNLNKYNEKKRINKIIRQSRDTIYQVFIDYKNFKEYPYHIAGWIIFFILAPLSIAYWFKLKNKKKVIKNSYDEIKDKFESWRFSIVSTLVLFVVLFYLSEQAITKFRPWIEEKVISYENITLFLSAILLGFLAIGDGFISSNLKTNLQRLSFNIQESVQDKDLKKELFFKSQEATETLKENLKKFGMLAIPALIIRAIGSTRWNNSKLSYIYYFIPVVYAGIRIIEVNRLIKRVKK